MAELERPVLSFPKGCPDPGQREVKLPVPLPDIGIDFNWDIRDFETFRDAMLEDLVLRFPERKRWTPADMEIVLIEVFAAVLDQLSDMADRVVAESYLETARRPESVYNWLSFIGMNMEQLTSKTKEELIRYWTENPHQMEYWRQTGPGKIHTQKRMTSLADYATRLEDHPLVERAYASRHWGGAWPVVWVMVSLWNNSELDQSIIENGEVILPTTRKEATDKFHDERGLRKPEWTDQETIRDILRSYIAVYRTIGQEVFLMDIDTIGIDITLCLRIGINYYQSEVKREALRVLGRGPGGFFEPGRLKVGEDLHVSDFYERLMNLDGVEHMEVKTFKKVGNLYPNKADTGEIAMNANELAICDNDPFKRERGLLNIQLYGGRRG
jgi:hypothetical protein